MQRAGMSYLDADISRDTDSQPRAEGTFVLSSKKVAGQTAIDCLCTSGSMKALFPRSRGSLEAIMINTSGGLTGGDRFSTDVTAGPRSDVVLTTQAAERAYRSGGGAAQIATQLRAAEGAFLAWVPQELIVFDGSALERRLDVELAPSSRLLMVEPLVFGRTAMGERLGQITFDDGINIRREGRPLYIDKVRINENAEQLLSRSALCRDARAMASVVYVSPDAEARCDGIRGLLPATGGASLIARDTLVVRLLALDGYLLRQTLIPILETLKGGSLPRSWSL